MMNRSLYLLMLFLLPLSALAGGRNYVGNNFFVPWEVTIPAEQAPAMAGSEVTTAPPQVEAVPEPAPVVAASAPSTKATATPAPAKEETAKADTGKTSVYDMRGCTYKRGSVDPDCYGSMSTVNRARRIMHAVNYINGLHNTKFDGRYMLCTGYRESTFNPGAKGADGERGMFQVMKATGKAALKYGVELPGFKEMYNSKGSEEYMTRMANSTVAQVELSFLVLKMKLEEDCTKKDSAACGRRTKIMTGRGETDDYRRLAGRYNGGGYNSVYAKRISSCYSCLRGKMSSTATNVGSEIQSCLNKAK